ncbi:MAG: hypothetical protein KDJ41_11910 [Hyphomicrobiaceae bacterium]|nr:hypothetical protein [Hyphomicrobiaceae bacterium]
MSLIWENSIWQYLILTLLLGGGAAWMAGRGLALVWKPFLRVAFYMLLLGAAIRFLHFALLDGTLLSLHYYIVDTATLIVAAGLGFRTTRVQQMARQYYWLYEATSPLTWRERNTGR